MIPGRQLPPRDGARRRERALDPVDHRAHPQRLLDDRIEVVVVPSGRELLAQPSEHGRVAHQQLEREREARGRGLVPGAQHREQLVAQLDVGHRATLLVARAHQQREDVGALLEVRLAATALDLLVEHLVGREQAAREAATRAERPEIGAGGAARS